MSRNTPTSSESGSRVCPTCGQRYRGDESPALPFCSERCRVLDLGRWLDEEIGVPFEGEAGDAPIEPREETDL